MLNQHNITYDVILSIHESWLSQGVSYGNILQVVVEHVHIYNKN
mgnify:CR=1 FL=1